MPESINPLGFLRDLQLLVTVDPIDKTIRLDPGTRFVAGDNRFITLGDGWDATVYFDGTNLVFEPRVVGSGNVVINDPAILFINETANANMNVGLTLNQGPNDNEILALKSSDVNHLFTSAMESDTYAIFQKATAATGGLTIKAVKEASSDAAAFIIHTVVGSEDTTHTAAGLAGVVVNYQGHDGAGSSTITAQANMFGVRDAHNGGTRFIVDAEGDLFADGSAATVYDDFDDLELAEYSDAVAVGAALGAAIDSEWAQMLREKEQVLIAANLLGGPVIGIERNKRGLVNFTGMVRMHNGTLRQLGAKVTELTEKLELAERKLQALGA